MSNTAADSLISCLRLGQTTLSNSSLVPWKKLPKLNPPPEVSAISASFFLATVVYPPSLINTAMTLLIFIQVDSFISIKFTGSKKAASIKQLHPKSIALSAILAVVLLVRAVFFTFRARPGGLEPPTSGFGDLRSTN